MTILGEPWRIGGAGAALAVALVGLLAWEGHARAAGREVALPIDAVDPRGLLTGHYVELALRQELAGAGCPPGTEQAVPTGPFGEGEPRAWVALSDTGAGWRVAGAASNRREAARLGPVAVRGSARCYPGGDGTVDLDIGITRFHADQGEAEAIERALIGRRAGEAAAFALVSVGRDGRARLNGLLVGGRRVELEWW